MRAGLLAPALFLVALVSFAAEKPPVKIEDVQVVGGTTISPDTVEYYLGVAKGDPYNPEAIAKNFHRFWDSGLVENLKVEAEDLPDGAVRLIVTVKERPRVTEYAFEGNKHFSTTSLKEKLDTAGFSLKRNVPLKESEIQKLKRAIEDEYEKDGYASAIVTTTEKDVGPNQRKVIFNIDEGSKVKIGKITFQGNDVFSDARLRRALKKVKQKSLFHLFGKKLVWSKEAWGEDSENLKKFYMNHGYKDIIVGEPKTELIARNPEGKTQKAKKFRIFVTIPVEEGHKFRLGSLRLVGNTVFPEKQLRKLYDVKPGKTYNFSEVDAGNEAVRALYQSHGYIYAYTNQTLTDRKDEKDVADVVINVYEGDRYRLGRLEFTGNTKTQEKVLRREFRLAEGDWMNMSTFKRSVFKTNQLGYFKLLDDPLEFKFDDVNKYVDVTVKGQEQGRNDIQFGAGYSQLDGFFVQASFGTRNFLGRGENMSLAVQVGGRVDTYSLSFSEPYFLDRRMVIGGSIFKQDLNISDQHQKSKGGSLLWGVAIGDFGQFAVSYSYEDSLSRFSIYRTFNEGDSVTPHQRPLPPPYKDIPLPGYFYETVSGVTSSLNPGYTYDSRDDPFDPNEGISYFTRLRYAGGPLGGTYDYLRPEAGFTIFHPISRKVILAGNVEGGIIKPFNGNVIPLFARYYLGGDRSLRGFDTYEVRPRKANGDYFLDASGYKMGGDRYLQLNLEYQIKVGGPVKFILFSDIGNTWYETQGWDLGLLRYSTGAELRIFLPMFQAPLRFIYGINLKPFPNEKKGNFQFSIGATF